MPSAELLPNYFPEKKSSFWGALDFHRHSLMNNLVPYWLLKTVKDSNSKPLVVSVLKAFDFLKAIC